MRAEDIAGIDETAKPLEREPTRLEFVGDRCFGALEGCCHLNVDLHIV